MDIGLDKDRSSIIVLVKEDPANYIIERFVQHQASWHNSRVTYRIRHWVPEDKRYYFEGDFFWIQNAYRQLKKLGVEDPESVPMVYLD